MAGPGTQRPDKAWMRLSAGRRRRAAARPRAQAGIMKCQHPAAGARPLKVVVFTTAFPSPRRPLHGLFVLERVRHAARHADVRVVAPVPLWLWSPLSGRRGPAEGLPV